MTVRRTASAVGIPVLLLLTGVQEGATPVRISDAQRDGRVPECLATPAGDGTTGADNEASAAAGGAHGRHVVAAWQTQADGHSVIQSAVSDDGGATWSVPSTVPINACAGGPVAQATRASDPWVAVGSDGRAYVAGLAWRPNPGGGPDLESAVVVAASTDGGRTWEAPRVAARGVGGRIWHDNVAVTVDPVRPRTVHLVTTRYDRSDSATRYGPVGYTVSRDGGNSWDPIRSITPEVNGGRISAPAITADPRSGVLYLVYYRAERPDRVVGVRRSDDGGTTWSEETTVTPHTPGAQPQLEPLEGRERPLADDIVRATVDPQLGAVYLAFADARREPRGRVGVYLVRSTDGRTWSAPVAVSDSGPQTAWLPAVAVSGSEVGVLFLSAIMDRSETGIAPVTVELRRYRVTGDSLSVIGADTVDRANYAWPGDYQGLIAAGHRFLAVYGRSTLGSGERYPPPENDPRRGNPSDIFATIIR